MTERTGWTDAELARLRLEALDHLTHLLSGTATEGDAAEVVAWRVRSRAHEEAFRSAVRLRMLLRDGAPSVIASAPGQDTGDVAENTGLDRRDAGANDNDVSIDAVLVHRLSRRGLLGGAIAASLTGGMLVLGRSMELVPSPSELRADYRTGTGERRLVALADGASVELNTRTSVDLRTDRAIPTIELISGEALLSSGRSGRAALLAGPGTSVASNGRFNARRDGNEVCITCLAGQVDVVWSGQKRVLEAQNQIRYNDRGIGHVLRGIDTVALTAWKTGTLIFRNMPMRAVIQEINRYRSGRVFLANEKLAGRPLSGTYYMNRLDEFFSQAELALGAKVTRLPGGVVILS